MRHATNLVDGRGGRYCPDLNDLARRGGSAPLHPGLAGGVAGIAGRLAGGLVGEDAGGPLQAGGLGGLLVELDLREPFQLGGGLGGLAGGVFLGRLLGLEPPLLRSSSFSAARLARASAIA